MINESTSFSPNKDAQSSLEQTEPTTLKKSWSNVAQMLKANKRIEHTNQFSVKSVTLTVCFYVFDARQSPFGVIKDSATIK